MDKRLWSSRISHIEPYRPGEQPKDRKYIKINTNENPYPPSPKVAEAIAAFDPEDLRLYPDFAALSLRSATAEYFGTTADRVFVGNGSDEILAFCYLAFAAPGEEVATPEISYSFYPVYADFFQNKSVFIPLRDDFSLPVEKFLTNERMIIIANPNAPTGIAVSEDDIARIAAANPDHAVIIDEAYVDFGAESAAGLTCEYDNLLVVQTFSKSRSLAGMRVGFALGDESLIAALEAVKNSFNSYTLDRVSLIAAEAAIKDRDYFEKTRSAVIRTREETSRELSALGFEVLPSKANFVFARHPDIRARELFTRLRERGILVRWFDRPKIDDFLRITIGTDDEMQALLRALREML